MTFDVSPPNAEVGVLLGFVEGRRGTPVAAARARTSVAARSSTASSGTSARQPPSPTSYVEKDWTAEEFTRGCYGAHFAPGVWTSYGDVLREPVGRLHWAGAEYAVEWNGYMEGAVRSGRTTADEVLTTAHP